MLAPKFKPGFCQMHGIKLPETEIYIIRRIEVCPQCGDHYSVVIAGKSMPAAFNENVLTRYVFDDGTFELMLSTEELLKALK